MDGLKDNTIFQSLKKKDAGITNEYIVTESGVNRMQQASSKEAASQPSSQSSRGHNGRTHGKAAPAIMHAQPVKTTAATEAAAAAAASLCNASGPSD